MKQLSDTEGLAFLGTLDSVATKDGSITALVYPFRSPGEVGDRLVLEITFHGPRFPLPKLERLVGQEIDLDLTETGAEVLSGLHDEHTFEAGAVSTAWRAWTIPDYHRCLEAMSRRESEQQDDVIELRQKLSHVTARLEDLLRRAELKAEGSPKQVAKQRPVIMALRQIKNLL
ncbi:hypothetical protein AAD018_010700 [Aestuariibius insulae]|uniref:hypothetical protein n=1 Tax=Aestuariibius insulae TaxID=2058287 RepID=UPI00345F0A66